MNQFMQNIQNNAQPMVIMLCKCQLVLLKLNYFFKDKSTKFGYFGTLHMWLLSCIISKVKLRNYSGKGPVSFHYIVYVTTC
jgi:hypothetical protein